MTPFQNKHDVILAFDTSCPILSVALHKRDCEIQEQVFEASMKHAENLLPLIDQLLQKENLKIRDVDAFLIGRGPGSFTGLRIGFATLKGFLCAFKRPVYGALSFDMIAENVPTKTADKLTVCLDARRDRLFLKHFCEKNGHWEAASEPQIASKEEVLSRLTDGQILTGDSLQKYHSFFADNSKNFKLLDSLFWYPKARSLISFFRESEKIEKLHPSIIELKSEEELLPFYFRLSQPEEMRKENAKPC